MGYIYKIINIKNDKFYLGSCKRICKRKNEHFRYLRSGKHCNSKLQAAFNEYGEENLKFHVIEECEGNILRREQQYLNELKPWIDGYNISSCACGGFCGVKSNKMRNVKQYDLKGNLIKVWESAGVIEREFGKRIYDNLYHRQRSAHGYIWCFADEEPILYDKYHDDCLRKPVNQYSLDGVFIKRWSSIIEAKNCLNIGDISAALTGYDGRKSAQGFIWKYAID